MFGGTNTLPTNVPARVPTNVDNAYIKKGKEVIQNFTGSNIGLMIIVFVMVVVLIYVLIYIYRQYNSTSLKTVTMVKKPIKVPDNVLFNISSDTDLSSLNNVNGKEFSYSLWMYVEGDNLNSTASNKLIMGRMEGEDIARATPVFVLDKTLNKVYVYVKNVNDNTVTGINDINSQLANVLTISYLPLQRWVNIVLVVDNNFVQLFMDGELREVKDMTRYMDRGMNSSIVQTPAGNMIVGSSTRMPAFNGYLSKVQILNYAVTIDHAKVIYKAGPLHRSVLTAIGVPTNYGIQNPFYRIDEQASISKCTE